MTARLTSDAGECIRKIKNSLLMLRYVWKFPCVERGWLKYEYLKRLESLPVGRTGLMVLKIDVQGAELDVLQGAGWCMKGCWDSLIRKTSRVRQEDWIHVLPANAAVASD